MTEIWNLNTLCRCCHSDGCFKSLNEPYQSEKCLEIYEVMLKEALAITISQPSPPMEASYTICDDCITKLRDASLFRQQVLVCEQKFQIYCTNEQFLNGIVENVKDKVELIPSEYSCEDIDYDDHSTQEVMIDVDIASLIHEAKENNNVKPNDRLIDKIEETTDEDEKFKTDITRITLKKQTAEDLKQDVVDPNKIVNKKKRISTKYSCDICQKQFSYSGYLEVHIKVHNGEKSFKCYVCNSLHLNNKELAKHITLTHSVSNQFPCNTCERIFPKPRLLITHLKSHFDNKFQCIKCQKVFKFKKGLNEHMKIHSEKMYSCEICNKSFAHSQNLTSHMLTHTKDWRYVCDICGRRFPQGTQLKRHIFNMHSALKPHICTVCNKRFSSKSYLVIHERQHTGERPYSCEVCKKEFSASTTLKVHMRIHTGFKPYSCSFCDKQFTQMASYKFHQRTHTGERPYSCKICKKPFANSGYLKIHMRVHSGEKPFSCKVCIKSFRDADQLRRHMHVHTGIKPYTCKICNKQISNLSKHMRVHSQEKPYGCNNCNKQFASKGNLKLHLRVHSGERPYACDVCNCQFSQSSALKRHRRLHLDVKSNA